MKKNMLKHSKLMVSLMLIPTVLGTMSTTGTALADNIQQRPASESATQGKTAIQSNANSSASSAGSNTSIRGSQSMSDASFNKSHIMTSNRQDYAMNQPTMKLGAMQSSKASNANVQSSQAVSSSNKVSNIDKAKQGNSRKKNDITKVQFEYAGKVIDVSNIHLNKDGSINNIQELLNELPANLRSKYELASLSGHKVTVKDGILVIPLIKDANHITRDSSSTKPQNSQASNSSSNDSAQTQSLRSNVAKSASQVNKSNASKNTNNTNKVLANNISNQVQANYHKTNQSHTVNVMARQKHQKQIKGNQYKVAIAHAVHAERKFERVTARTRSEMMPTPRRYVTPLPSRKYTIHRTHVSNPMFLTNHAYRHYAHVYHGSNKHFKNTVKMTKTTEPSRNMSKVKPFKGFDKSVLRYKPYLDKVCQHYHMQKYETLFLAIMENETHGEGSDVMQSSESLGMSPGSLSPQQSIEQAVKYMKSIVGKAQAMDRAERKNKKMKPADYHDYSTDSALLAQTYNYGAGFLDFVSKSKEGYNVNVAQKYSRDVVAPRLGNSSGKTYTYDNPIAKMYHKTFLYVNGGNYFYGPMVEQYMTNGTFMHQMLQHLIKYAGQKYVFGGKSPKQGFDCSGLVSYGFKLLHVDLPSYTVTQWHDTKPVKSINDAKPGDLIFFKGTYGSPNFISHVELVVDRDTMFGSDGSGVGFHDIHQPYWNKHFAGIRRIPQANKLNKQANKQLEKEVKSAVNEYNN